MNRESDEQPEGPPRERRVDDDSIRELVARLARPHRSGGRVVERATLLAAGADFRAVMAWIDAHGGAPETPGPAGSTRGLHGARGSDAEPLRFVVPAAAFTPSDTRRTPGPSGAD